MVRTLLFSCALLAGSLCLTGALFADSYPVILSGKVTLPDGSPPPISMGLERICSDGQGSAPGPLTNKKGEYIWRLDVDPLSSRACYIKANSPGYASTTVDVSALPGITTTNIKLDTIVVTPRGADPEQIVSNEGNVPGKALANWKAAMKALDVNNYSDSITNLQAAVQAVPKFAQGWHTLGILLNHQHQGPAARDAFEHAIAADPKYTAAYASLARQCIRTKDWDAASKAADSAIKADSKHLYLENYLHLAVARYQLKDLDGALAAVQQAIMLDKTHVLPRTEYVWGRVLEAKGDLDGARQHMTHYLELEKSPADSATVKAHINNLGKAGATGTEPDLEVL
jgi:Tfp pilus assembly protein PilF